MFNLNDASESNSVKYQQPGISVVTFKEVLQDKTKTNQVPFIKLVTEGENKEVGSSSQMFLSTEVKAGKKMAAWNVTARNLVDILMSANNWSEEEAKASIAVANIDQLVTKLSALLVGKKVRAKFKGETSQKGNVFAILAQTESLQVDESTSRLKFDPIRDIKPFQGVPQTDSVNAEVEGDLPF